MAPIKIPTKVAVLDDYQSLSKDIFAKLDPSVFSVEFFPDTLLPFNHPSTPQSEKDKLVERLKPFQIICTMRERTPFPAALINSLPNLKLMLTTGTRNLGLDMNAFAAANVPVYGTGSAGLSAKDGGPDSTTQHCVTLNMALARNIASDDLAMKNGAWQSNFATGLSGRVFGTVGLGRLGVAVARIMHVAFAMKVVAWSENLTQEKADAAAEGAGLPKGTFRAVSREELFSGSDLINVHVVLSDRSRGMINKGDFAVMKPSALFVNTARGPIVVQEDLLDVLQKGKIRGAALDVYEIEPLPKDSPWRTTKWGEDGRSQVLLTPHMGYIERETLANWYEQQVENLGRWAKGEELVNQIKAK